MNHINFAPQGALGALLDTLLEPCMAWFQDTADELPQRTHPWNNIKLRVEDVAWLSLQSMVTAEADLEAKPRSLVPLYHAPRLGGWREFVVLEGYGARPWFVGWIAGDVCGISRIPLYGHVRMLRGNTQVQFFGVNLSGYQLNLSQVGAGRIGTRHQYGDIPLL